MSILNVEHLSHGFGDRAIFTDVSFRLLKGEHIGLIGANGEGKSTFMNIVTGKLMPDEGKVEWAKNVHAGYLDQHAVLEKGMTIRDVLKSAFDPLLQKEQRMNEICDMLGSADPEEMDALMEELGNIQDELTLHDFYVIDARVEEVARALGLLDLGLERDVTDLSGGQRTKILLAKLLLEKPDILLLDEPTNYLDEEHIAWLKRCRKLSYANTFVNSAGCRMSSYFLMKLNLIFSKLSHISQNGNPPAGSVLQNVQRRLHGHGICIIAVIYDQKLVCFDHSETAADGLQTFNPSPDLLCCQTINFSDRRCCKSIIYHMDSRHRYKYRKALLSHMDPAGHSFQTQTLNFIRIYIILFI